MFQSIFRRFSYLWIAIGLFFQMEPNDLMIFHAWVSRSGHFCEREQNPVRELSITGLTGIGIICFGLHLHCWESWFELGCEIFIFWSFDDNLWNNRFVTCMFWCIPSTFDAWLSNFITWLSVMITSWCVYKLMLWNFGCEKRTMDDLEKEINRSINHSIVDQSAFR